MFNPSKLERVSSRAPGEGYKDYDDNWYPFIYYDAALLEDGRAYDEITFIRDTNLFITGYTSQLQGDVLFYVLREAQIAFNPKYTYSQTANAGAQLHLYDVPLRNDALEGATQINLETPGELNAWTPGRYINFAPLSSLQGRTDYTNYGKFYQITNSVYSGVQGQTITFTPELQKDVSADTMVYLYDEDHPYKWFGEDVKIDDYDPSGDNLRKLVLGLDDGLNTGQGDDIYVFIDNEPPRTTFIAPVGGAVDPNEPIVINFTEHVGGAGLKEESLRFDIRRDGVLSTRTTSNGVILTNEGEQGGFYRYSAEYVPLNNWSNGNYNVSIFIEDLAGNLIENSGINLEFVVDKDMPGQPLFTVIGADESNIDVEGRTVVDNSQPTFELDFANKSDGTVEPLFISLPLVNILEPAGYSSVGCNRQEDIKNVFICSFNDQLTEGLYSLEVSTHKILPDARAGPTGTFLQDREGKPLIIIVDNTAPSFILRPESQYVVPGSPFAIFVNVTNEHYGLMSEIAVGGEVVNLELEQQDDGTYLFIIPADFNWGVEGPKVVSVAISDYAGHRTTITTTLTVDSTPPSIIITDIEADRGFLTSNTNATVGVRQIKLIGLVDSDTESLCYLQRGGENFCIFECVAGEDEGCIRRLQGSSQDEFTITLIVEGENSRETLNTVLITLRDFSGHETTASLYVLLDLAPPAEPLIIFR
jgi:hypothetical protein